MSKVKILFITVRADHGGGPKHIDQLIQILNSDFELYLACPSDEPYYSQWLNLLGSNRIFRIPHRKFSLMSFFSLVKWLKRERIEILHSHGKGAGIYARLLKVFLPESKTIHTFHGIHVFSYNFIQKKLYIGLERLLSRLTDQFINVSYSEKKACLNAGIIKETDSLVIYNASVDLGFQNNGRSKKVEEKKFIVATVTRFDISKNMQLALQIARALKHRKDIKFRWIGDGPDKAELQVLSVQEELNIEFTGFQDNISGFLRSSSLYLSTSRWEGLPISLLEASSLGLPLVATDVTGNNEIVEHRVNGFLFHSDKPLEAAYFLEQLCDNQKLFEQVSRQARAIFLKKFDIGIMGQAYQQFYASFISN